MIQAEWKGLDSLQASSSYDEAARAKPEVASLLRGVANASARAASKAAKGHRKSGRLQASIKPHTTETTAGFSAALLRPGKPSVARHTQERGSGRES